MNHDSWFMMNHHSWWSSVFSALSWSSHSWWVLTNVLSQHLLGREIARWSWEWRRKTQEGHWIGFMSFYLSLVCVCACVLVNLCCNALLDWLRPIKSGHWVLLKFLALQWLHWFDFSPLCVFTLFAARWKIWFHTTRNCWQWNLSQFGFANMHLLACIKAKIETKLQHAKLKNLYADLSPCRKRNAKKTNVWPIRTICIVCLICTICRICIVSIFHNLHNLHNFNLSHFLLLNDQKTDTSNNKINAQSFRLCHCNIGKSNAIHDIQQRLPCKTIVVCSTIQGINTRPTLHNPFPAYFA